MTDRRRILRATPPDPKGKSGRVVQVHFDADDYEALYFGAFDAQLSIADYLRQLVREAPR